MDAWKLAWSDDGAQDWKAGWFLDGDKSKVQNTPTGMVLTSGDVKDDNAGHAVLWTKQSFRGDLRIEYDFTRIDERTKHVAVCILYIQATGIGKEPYVADIFEWRDLRRSPKMSLYFNFMRCYHVSYACTGGADADYVRARCYPSEGNFDRDTRVAPSYENVGFFKPGETWHMLFEKVGRQLTFTATRNQDKKNFTWDVSKFDAVDDGRIGLRQMHGRESRYANFKIFTRP